MPAANKLFWQKQPGLVWSNPEASDAVHIRAALARPRFGQLLEMCAEFGLERVRGEWAELVKEPTPETERARAAVERILRNIGKGFASAAASHVGT